MAAGPGNGSTPGARGGWSWTLKTENLMKDGKPQPSLSESLRSGVAMAHRRINMDTTADNRNFRRSNPLAPLHDVVGAYVDNGGVRVHEQAAPSLPPDQGYNERTPPQQMIGVSRDVQLDLYRRRMNDGGSKLPLEAHLRLRRAGYRK